MEILRYAEENGMVANCRQYDIAQSLYYRWKNRFDQQGIDGLAGWGSLEGKFLSSVT